MSSPVERTAAIRARLEAATPGPWGWSEFEGELGIFDEPTGLAVFNSDPLGTKRPADADMLANAPSDLQFLLERLESAEARITKALALHPQVVIQDGPDNAFPACDFCAQEWPCSTVATLEGNES